MAHRFSMTKGARRSARVGTLAGAAFSAVLAGCFALVGRAQSPETAPAVSMPSASAPGAAPGATGAPGATAAVAPSPTVKITLITVPAAKRVMVLWGKRRVGVIAPHQPLFIQRPRDSGPLDLILQSEGYIPVQTRAFTFGDSKLAVKLTPIDQKKTLLGYREEVPPPALAPPDGGTPPPIAAPASAAPPPTVAAPAPDAGAR